MTDNSSSSTPEEGGNNKSAADKSDKKGITNPKKKNPPRNSRTKNWFGLTKAKWREIAGIVVLIPWVWNDFLDTHNIIKLCLLAITIAVAQGAALTFFNWRGVVLAIWLFSLVPVARVVWLNSKPEPKPEFRLGVHSSHDPMFTALTNNIIGDDPGKILPALVVKGFTNENVSSLVFSVINVSPIPIEDAEFLVTIPKVTLADADGWEVRLSSSTNLIVLFFRDSKTLLLGDIAVAPPLNFLRQEPNTVFSLSSPEYGAFNPVGIIIRATHLDETRFAFSIGFQNVSAEETNVPWIYVIPTNNFIFPAK